MLPESPALLSGFQAFATPGTLPPSVTAPHLRSLPSAVGFPGTTGLSATLTARPAPRGVPVDVCRISPRASRVAAFFPFHACQRHYPDGSGSVPASLSSPSANGLPLKSGGSASVLSVSRPARRSLAFRPAWSLSRPWRPLTPECFRPYRCLHDPPWLLPTGATVVGRGSHPLEEGAFPRRTGPSWISLFPFTPLRVPPSWISFWAFVDNPLNWFQTSPRTAAYRPSPFEDKTVYPCRTSSHRDRIGLRSTAGRRHRGRQDGRST